MRQIFRICSAMAVLCAVVMSGTARADAPYTPADAATVLERLPAARGADAALAVLHARSVDSPGDVGAAVAFARAAIERGREEQDPRYFGYAECALQRWWALASPPPSVVLLRATIAQWHHDFAAAERDLDTLINTDADESTQAHLTRASVRAVTGDPIGALRDCTALIGRTDLLTATTCIAAANSLRGRASASLTSLQSVIARDPQRTPAALQLWSLTTAAEIAERLGYDAQAQSLYDQALVTMDRSGQRDAYLLAAFSDFALDHGRPRAVVSRLAGDERIDNLLLRLALAERRLSDEGEHAFDARVEDHIRQLAQRFAETRERGDTVHLREESLFELELQRNPQRALSLAATNWTVQREPLDARVLLAAALANRQPRAAQPVLQWMRDTHIEDRRLQELARQLAAIGVA